MEASHDGAVAYRPCAAVLRDDTVHVRVVFAEARRWLDYWGVEPEDDDETVVLVGTVPAAGGARS